MLLLKQNITKNGQIDNDNTIALLKQDEDNTKKYKVKTICNNKVYAKKLDNSYLPGLYYLVF